MARDLLSLIDDLIHSIFNYAVLDDLDNGAFMSLKLSHISQRYRSLLLANPKFWTIIRHGPELRSMDYVDACLERSNGLPLSIVVSVVAPEHDPLIIETHIFMTRIRERAADRCKSIRVYYLPRPSQNSYLRPSSSDTYRWCGMGVFPELQILDIRFPSIPTLFVVGTGIWTQRFKQIPSPFPKLQNLSLRGFAPYCINGYNDLATLNITSSDVGLTRLPQFLESCHALQNLHLTLHMSRSARTQLLPRTFPLASLRDFRFTLLVDGSLEAENRLKHIFSLLVFPNLPTLDIRIEFLDEESWRNQWVEPVDYVSCSVPEVLDFGEYLREIIREDKFPSVETLRISLAARFTTISTYQSAKFSVPVQFLPALRSLSLQSDMLLSPDVDQGGNEGRRGGDLRVNLDARLLIEKLWLERINGTLDS
ncbi:hypothetical protein SCHPADRAFT_886198 [Schizopora paradoxa]|uniref:F-box domain-containing protein n=1 Tax=Schizopora paradoxa TaxID=27342 RepID=A0A0H2S2F4_9AGAM|nr:hypothetical protein SCHPADRAFT_886198 [Schizopora paradoxa]